jgi:hypothetical protein
MGVVPDGVFKRKRLHIPIPNQELLQKMQLLALYSCSLRVVEVWSGSVQSIIIYIRSKIVSAKTHPLQYMLVYTNY